MCNDVRGINILISRNRMIECCGRRRRVFSCVPFANGRWSVR